MDFSLKMARLRKELSEVSDTYYAHRRDILLAHGTETAPQQFDVPKEKRASAESALNELDEAEITVVTPLLTISAIKDENSARVKSGKISPDLLEILLGIETVDTESAQEA